MKKLIIANWKMNPPIKDEALFLLKSSFKIRSLQTTLVICPPFPFLSLIKKSKNINLGAQDVSLFSEGPYTGEVGGGMLKSLGVSFVIVGHSERRALGENVETISKKLKNVIKNRMTPVLCVGERSRGKDGEHFVELRENLISCLKNINKKEISKVIIAYEPIWAISTNKMGSLDPESIRESILFLKRIIFELFGKVGGVKYIYGGSVDDMNAKEILSIKEVEGALVGKASLNLNKLKTIIKSVS